MWACSSCCVGRYADVTNCGDVNHLLVFMIVYLLPLGAVYVTGGKLVSTIWLLLLDPFPGLFASI